jgi:hypothetical protein
MRLSLQGKRELVMLPKLGFSHISIARSKEFGVFSVKDKTKLSFQLVNPADWGRLEARNV